MARFSTSILLVTILLGLAFANTANAARLYRCGKVIQFRPCEFPADESIVSDETPRYKMRLYPVSVQNNGPTISDVRFEQAGGGVGVWRGYVRGSGPVDLHLWVHENGSARERYMGRVVLKTAGKLVPFVFRSSVPVGNNWNWDVRAISG